MPTVTVNIAGRGTPTSDGDTTATGHMWYTVTDSASNSASYRPVTDFHQIETIKDNRSRPEE